MAFHALSIIRENDTSATFVDMSQHIINEAELVNVVSQWRAQCLSICSIALMVWDTIITIDQEVERIWRPRPRISLIKMFFWINRCAPFPHASTKVNAFNIWGFLLATHLFKCFTAFVYTQIAQVMIVGIIQSALAIRVWALYEQNRGVLGLFILLVGGSTIYAAVINWVCLRVCAVLYLYLNYEVNGPLVRVEYETDGASRISDILRILDVFQSACNQISPQFPSIYRTTFYSALVLEVH
ncbi:hypothetical protein K439DRAFT_1616706 [Ramaria rubella]|nr:hypothetical protein K439DRAFT_1616706 [Ramaria rubella]